MVSYSVFQMNLCCHVLSLHPKAEKSLNPSSVPKRKRGNENTERVPKRLKTSLITEGAVGKGQCHISPAQGVQENPVLTVKRQPKSNKLSRSHRLRQQNENPADLANNRELYSGSITHTESDNPSLRPSDSLQRGKLVMCCLVYNTHSMLYALF